LLLHDTLPVDLPDLCPSDILILALFLFLTHPEDLYYLGYKNNNNKNNNNNNNHNNVYVAVIMTKVIARVHLVQLMNAG